MSLHYELPADKFALLSEEDKEFYNDVLPWLMMFTKVNEVSKKTIPILAYRAVFYVDCVRWPSAEAFLNGYNNFKNQAWWQKWEGMKTNVRYESDAQWVKSLK